jgi:C-terminal processing protease CtpA/Prc
MQAHARQSNKDVLESCAVMLSSRINALERQETPKRNPEIFLAEIGITVSAVDGRYFVRSVHQNAPTAVGKKVYAGDEVVSIDEKAVRHTSPNDIKSMLKRCGT